MLPYCASSRNCLVQENLKKTYESELEKYMIRVLPLGSGLPAFHLSTLGHSKHSLTPARRERASNDEKGREGGRDGWREREPREKERGCVCSLIPPQPHADL